MTDKIAETAAAHRDQFRRQAEWCRDLGSPFTAALLDALSGRIGQGGALDALLAPHDPAHQSAVHLRLAGALHALALTLAARAAVGDGDAEGRGSLLALYERAWARQAFRDADLAIVLSVLEDRREDIARFMQIAPQTNEVRRAAALLPAFAKLNAAPLHLLETGCSAGLMQHFGHFNYSGPDWELEGAEGAPHISTDWRGGDFPAPEFDVASLAGCDLAPIDIGDPAARRRLKAYTWPDQPDRHERLDAALALAERRGLSLERESADSWLEHKLGAALPVGTTVVFHTVVWQYFPLAVLARATEAIEAAGRRAEPGRELAWISMEHASVFDRTRRYNKDEGYLVTLRRWPGNTSEIVARADPHARWIEVLA